MADPPPFDPNKPYTTGSSGPPKFDPSKPYTTGSSKSDTTDPLISELQDPGWSGTLPRIAAGVTQGFVLDPWEKGAELTGTSLPFDPARLKATREAAGSTTPGQLGRFAGMMANPLWRLLPAVPVTRYAGAEARALAKLLTSAYQGALGGASQPTGATTPAQALKDTRGQAESGGVIGTLLGAPGALATRMGFEHLQQPIREFVRDLPLEFRRLANLRNLSKPAFTNWWHEQSVAPIGGKVPGVASKATMDKVGAQIGEAIDRASRNMTFDPTNPAVRTALGTARSNASINLASSGNALGAYNSIIDRLVSNPLRVVQKPLSAQELQTITSNLDAHIRLIDPSRSPDNALLKSELENYRDTMLDNASFPTPAQKKEFDQARNAWRIHAIGRDSQGTGEPHGHIDPDLVAKELDRRNPLRFPYGGGPRGMPDPLQSGVEAAQKALGNMAAAARRGKSGRPLRELGNYAFPAGVEAAPLVAPIVNRLTGNQEQNSQ